MRLKLSAVQTHISLCVTFPDMNPVSARLSTNPQMRLSLFEQSCAGERCPREAFVSVSKILFVGMSQQDEFLPLSLRIAVEPTVSRVAQRSRLFTDVLLTPSTLTV